MSTVSVVVADDQPLVRSGLVLLLQADAGVRVVAEAADGREAVERAHQHRPDLVVMDLRMPGTDGVTATRLLTADPDGSGRAVDPDHLTKVLVVTTFDDDESVYGALRAGASGFLLKQAAPRDLLTAVRAIAAGEAWIDPGVAGSVIAAYIRIMESEAAATDPAGQRTLIERILAEARASLPAEERDSFDRFAARGLETVGEREQLVAATQAGDAVTFEGAFSAIRSRCVDFGITMSSRCTHQRSRTCAGVRPARSAICPTRSSERCRPVPSGL